MVGDASFSGRLANVGDKVYKDSIGDLINRQESINLLHLHGRLINPKDAEIYSNFPREQVKDVL